MSAIKNDWAIIKLVKTFDSIKPIRIRSLTGDETRAMKQFKFSTAGYPQDRPYLLDVVPNCEITDFLDDATVIVTSCDSTYGDSGAPLLMMIKAETIAVGIFSAATSGNSINPATYAVNASVFERNLEKQ